MNQQSTNAIRPLPDDLAERIDLAAQVFADNGLDATRIEHLAKRLGFHGRRCTTTSLARNTFWLICCRGR